MAIVNWVAANPMDGAVIEGSGGARKIRFGGKGKGKSGGYRVITFYSGPEIPIFLLNLFAKNQKATLSKKEREVLKSLLAGVVTAYSRKGKGK